MPVLVVGRSTQRRRELCFVILTFFSPCFGFHVVFFFMQLTDRLITIDEHHKMFTKHILIRSV